MNTAASSERREEERVTPLELFMDLTLVLVFIQATSLMSHGGWLSIAHGVLILALIWYAWVSFSWLTSVIDPERGVFRLLLLLATGALLLVAVAVPNAFDRDAFLFAFSYGLVRLAHVVLFFVASRDDDRLRASTRAFSVSALVGVALVITGSFFDGWVLFALWIAALLIDAAGPYVSGVEGWQLVPGHFAERHGHIVIIALGESIISVGFGVGLSPDGAVLSGVVVAFVLIAALWWLYFDLLALLAEERLREADEGRERNALARDAYSYLHFPMIAGIVLMALGTKLVLAHPEDTAHAIVAFALGGGFGLYLLGNYAFKVRIVGSIYKNRLVGGIVALAIVPVLAKVDGVVTLGVIGGLAVAMVILDSVVHAPTRERLQRELGSRASS